MFYLDVSSILFSQDNFLENTLFFLFFLFGELKSRPQKFSFDEYFLSSSPSHHLCHHSSPWIYSNACFPFFSLRSQLVCLCNFSLHEKIKQKLGDSRHTSSFAEFISNRSFLPLSLTNALFLMIFALYLPLWLPYRSSRL